MTRLIYAPSPAHDISIIWPDWARFTAVEPAQARYLRVLQTLRDPELIKNGKAISNCTRRNRCELAACRKCLARARRFVGSEQLRLFASYADSELRVANLVSPRDRYRPSDLSPPCLIRAANRIRKLLERAGVSVLAIGGTDIDYDYAYSVYQIGHHLLMTRRDAMLLASALMDGASYRSCEEIHKPIFLTSIKNRVTQVAYTFMAEPHRKLRWQCKPGKWTSRKVSMKNAELLAWLNVMARIDPLQLLILIGSRRTNEPSIEPT